MHARPVVEDFLRWAELQFRTVEGQRGSLRSALGYTVRQANALRTFLEDGRLRLDNNLSENALRNYRSHPRCLPLRRQRPARRERRAHPVADRVRADGTTSTPSATWHDVIRVLAVWPRGRYLELSPKYWAETRDTARSPAAQRRARPDDRAAAPELATRAASLTSGPSSTEAWRAARVTCHDPPRGQRAPAMWASSSTTEGLLALGELAQGHLVQRVDRVAHVERERGECEGGHEEVLSPQVLEGHLPAVEPGEVGRSAFAARAAGRPRRRTSRPRSRPSPRGRARVLPPSLRVCLGIEVRASRAMQG